MGAHVDLSNPNTTVESILERANAEGGYRYENVHLESMNLSTSKNIYADAVPYGTA